MGRRATFTQAELAAAAKVAVAGGVSITLEDADGRRAIVSPVEPTQEKTQDKRLPEPWT